jgi:hypothetical protein
MGTEQGPTETARVVKGARPFTGFILGMILGIAIAVIVQQAGVWPLDRLLLYGSIGVFGLIGILIGGAGRQKVGPFTSILPLILAVGLIGFGATGLTSVNETGEINGGCAVQATSSLDTTVVTDTSRRDPFVIDPDGTLSWVATSPGPITDHLWNIYVDVGGFSVPIAGNDEPEPNTDGSRENVGDVADVSSYIQEVSDASGLELRGVFEVSGDIEGGGGACDGFGFVRLDADPLATLIAQIAAGVALVALIALLILAINRTREAELVLEDDDIDRDSYAEVGGSASAAGAAGAARDLENGQNHDAGAHERHDGRIEDVIENEQVDDGPRDDT